MTGDFWNHATRPDQHYRSRQNGLMQRGLLSPAMLMLLCCLFTLAPGLAAGEPDAERPYIAASQRLAASATVESIDLETREVILRTQQGKKMTFIAGETVQNLAQAKVGDVVEYDYVSNMSLILVRQPGPVPDAKSVTVQSEPGAGGKPGVNTVDRRIETAEIVAIDRENDTFELEWADGSIAEYTAENPENLAKAEVGDFIVITRMEQLIISVKTPEQQ